MSCSHKNTRTLAWENTQGVRRQVICADCNATLSDRTDRTTIDRGKRKC